MYEMRLCATYKMLAWLYTNAGELGLTIKHDPAYVDVVVLLGSAEALNSVQSEFFYASYRTNFGGLE